VENPNPYTVGAPHADTKFTGRCFVQVMAQSAVDKIALTAEEVFGWKNVHNHEGSLVGKKAG
jgi:hypothetical protein